MTSMEGADMKDRTVEVQTEPFECVPHWLLFEADISANALRVYLILRKHRDYDTSECHPSRKRLARMAGGIAVSTLDRALSELVAAGAVTIKKRFRDDQDGGGQTSNGYRVHWDRLGAVTTHEQPPYSPVTSPPIQNWYTNEDPDNQDPLNEDPRDELITSVNHFDEFYRAYPRHKARGQAEKAWDKAVKHTDPAVIVAGAIQFRQWCQADDKEAKFIPYPATWLNAKSWLDERDPEKQTNMQAHIALVRELWENDSQGYPQLEG